MSINSCDDPTFEIIVQFCDVRPCRQMNQIAVASRRCNVAWRRMYFSFVRRYVRIHIEDLEYHGDNDVFLIDLADVLGLQCTEYYDAAHFQALAPVYDPCAGSSTDLADVA